LSRLKLAVIALVAGNCLLLLLEASKAPVAEPVAQQATARHAGLPEILMLSELEPGRDGAFGRQCFTVGPFETRATAEAITGMLRAYSTRVSDRATEAFVDRGYWVYLPPYPDERSAREAVRSLYDAEFEDVAIIRDGEWNLSVSLGYFISQDNAVRRRDLARERGFPAEFNIQRHDEPRFWVDYEQQAGVEYASRVLSSLVPPELHRMTACPEAGGLAMN